MLGIFAGRSPLRATAKMETASSIDVSWRLLLLVRRLFLRREAFSPKNNSISGEEA
jgi:hypothetical protein